MNKSTTRQIVEIAVAAMVMIFILKVIPIKIILGYLGLSVLAFLVLVWVLVRYSAFLPDKPFSD